MFSLFTFFGNFIDFLANFIQSLINLGLVLQHKWLDNSVVDRVSSIPRYGRHAPAKKYQLQHNTPDYNLHEEQAFFKSTNACLCLNCRSYTLGLLTRSNKLLGCEKWVSVLFISYSWGFEVHNFEVTGEKHWLAKKILLQKTIDMHRRKGITHPNTTTITIQ